MGSGALVAFIAWQLAQAGGARQMRGGENPLSISNIQLLIPLMVSDTNQASDESDESGKDMPFSSIPSSAFILDESPPAATPDANNPSPAQGLAYRPRSAYLEGTQADEGSELDAEFRRACSRLASSPAARGRELLLLLCSELLDTPPAPPVPPAPPAPACPCCQQGGALAWLGQAASARRDLVPLGGDANMVKSYMRSSRKKRRPAWWQ